jgi:hypothetical protein
MVLSAIFRKNTRTSEFSKTIKFPRSTNPKHVCYLPSSTYTQEKPYTYLLVISMARTTKQGSLTTVISFNYVITMCRVAHEVSALPLTTEKMLEPVRAWTYVSCELNCAVDLLRCEVFSLGTLVFLPLNTVTSVTLIK